MYVRAAVCLYASNIYCSISSCFIKKQISFFIIVSNLLYFMHNLCIIHPATRLCFCILTTLWAPIVWENQLYIYEDSYVVLTYENYVKWMLQLPYWWSSVKLINCLKPNGNYMYQTV
jgi:hypothetical protein